MPIKSELDRQNHPQARLIPAFIFNKYLTGYLGDDDLAVMTSDKEWPKDSRSIKRFRYWLCILIGHPELDDKALMQAATDLSLTPSEIMNGALIVDKKTLYTTLIQDLNLNSLDVLMSAFSLVSELGNLEMLRTFIRLFPQLVNQMVAYKNYQPFRLAAINGHADVVEEFFGLVESGDERMQMIAAYDYDAFCWTVGNGHLNVFEIFIRIVPAGAEQQKMISAQRYIAFNMAASNGYQQILERILTIARPDQVNIMITTWGSSVFQAAIKKRLFNILAILIKTSSIQTGEQIAIANDCSIIRLMDDAEGDEFLPVIEWAFSFAGVIGYVKKNPSIRLKAFIEPCIQKKINALRERKQIFEHNNPDAIFNLTEDVERRLYACIVGELAIKPYIAWLDVMFLLAIPSVEFYITETVVDIREELFHEVVRFLRTYNDEIIKNAMLNVPYIFSMLEIHDHEYGRLHVHPFVLKKMNALRERKQALEMRQANAVFNLNNPNEIAICFYMLRNLIRRNSPLLSDDIRFLLDIPAVKELVAPPFRGGQPNVMLRMALVDRNQEIIELLLNIPAVRLLAERNDYYRTEMREGLDLRVLARDRESSMNALTTGEKKRLDAVISRYQPIMRTMGVSTLMQELRDALVERYEKRRASIQWHGYTVYLPVDWQTFHAINPPLGEFKYNEALRAYYQHKDHTALRYVSKPNRWMHPRAEYVNVNPENLSERWSTFEEYQPLIGILWLAASDESVPAIDGYTLEGRIAQFIDELALIGRAHNWDKTDRENEYDDREGDRPSCYSGVKRRLFQSVQGHPLIKLLTLDNINEELRDFIREHFKALITNENKPKLLKAWQEYVVTLDFEDAAELKQLDIPEEKQKEFIQYLTQKYGPSFSDEYSFKKYIEDQFTLHLKKNGEPLEYAHALKFSALVQLENLVKLNGFGGTVVSLFQGQEDKQEESPPIKRLKFPATG